VFQSSKTFLYNFSQVTIGEFGGKLKWIKFHKK